MNRIEQKFKDLRKAGKKAFVAFITAGYPSIGSSEKLILGFSRIGVDIIEIGVPFSDPLADGPVIQESSQEALKQNTHLAGILNLVKKVRKVTQVPICLMTYYNPVFCFGEQRFCLRAKECGVDGLIIPDLPPEEAGNLSSCLKKAGIDMICFISPTTSRERIKFVSRVSRGFIYYVSLTGVTGPRKAVAQGLRDNVNLIRKYTRKPICVGFGVSGASQVRRISKIADGVIVGSAIVKKIKENIGRPDLAERVAKFVEDLKA